MRRKDIAIIVLAVGGIYGWLQFSHPGLQQDDYFHLRLTEMMRREGVLHEFPWMKHTIFSERFVDKHFGFHVLLVPFTLADDLKAGGKAATVVMVLALGLAFYGFLARHGVRYALFWTFFFLFSSKVVMLRLLAVRPIAFSVLLYLLALHWMLRRRPFLLGAVALVFGWAYSAFPVLLGIVILFTITDGLYHRTWDLKPVLAAIAGMGLSIVVNPYFPDNLRVMAVQYLSASLVRSDPAMNLEWMPLSTWEFFSFSWPLWVVIGLVLFLVASGRVRPRFETLCLFLLAAFFFITYSKVSRGIDQFYPFAVLFSAFAVSDATLLAGAIGRTTKRLAAVLAMAAAVFVVILNVRDLKEGFREMDRIDNSGSALWLKEHAAKGSEVFIANYAAFSQLFFYNREQVYTLGLDPLFMKAKDERLYRLYNDALALREDPYLVIHDVFGASYVHVEHIPRNRGLIQNFAGRRDRFELVFRDDFSDVYRVK